MRFRGFVLHDEKDTSVTYIVRQMVPYNGSAMMKKLKQTAEQ